MDSKPLRAVFRAAARISAQVPAPVHPALGLAIVLSALALFAGGATALAADSAPANSHEALTVQEMGTSSSSAPAMGGMVPSDPANGGAVTIPPAIADAAASRLGMGSDSSAPATGGTGPGTTVGGVMPGAPADGAKGATSNDAKADAAIQGDQQEDTNSLLGPEPPTRVRVAILNATGKAGGANKVAVLLSEVKRQALEDQIGLQVEVVNLSTAEAVRPGQSILFYRPEFLRAALAMAEAIPGEQFVEPMRPAGMKRAGVDVEIVVGKELP